MVQKRNCNIIIPISEILQIQGCHFVAVTLRTTQEHCAPCVDRPHCMHCHSVTC